MACNNLNRHDPERAEPTLTKPAMFAGARCMTSTLARMACQMCAAGGADAHITDACGHHSKDTAVHGLHRSPCEA